MEKLTVDVWSDIMCPYCYLGDTHLELALANFDHAEDVLVRYHSYQLMPELSDEPANMEQLLSNRYGAQQLAAQQSQLQSRGEQLGIEYNFADSLAVNTARAHQLYHFAEELGVGHRVMLLLFKAHFTDGVNVADIDELVAIAAEAGLDAVAARTALEDGTYAQRVTADIDTAKNMGVQGVPFFVFGDKYALSGAQPVEVFEQALNTAWAETN